MGTQLAQSVELETLNLGVIGSSPTLGGIKFGEGNGNPLQYSCPENSMDRGAWQA